MKLIGLCGGMGCGKSTAVEFLRQKYGDEKIRLVKFAQPLYDMQEYIYRRIAPSHQRPQGFVKDRFLLQFLGTDWGRGKIKDSLWIDLWKDNAEHALSEGLIVVVDDVRFDNEAQAIKDMGGTILEIISHSALQRINTNTGTKGHASESGVDPELVEYAIVNDGTIEEYKNLLNNTFNLALSNKVV